MQHTYKMAGVFACCISLILAFMTPIHGSESIGIIVNQVSLLEKEIGYTKGQFSLLEQKLVNKMVLAETVLRADLIENIMPSLVSRETKHFIAEVRQVKQAFQHMKKSYSLMSHRLETVGDYQEMQEQEIDRLKHELSLERKRYMKQVTLLQNQLNTTQHKVIRLERDIKYLSERTSLKHSGSNKDSPHEQCVCKSPDDKLPELLQFERRLVSFEEDNESFKETIGVIKKRQRRDFNKFRKKLLGKTTKNKKLMLNVASELGTKIFLKDLLVKQMEEKTDKISKNVNRIRKDFEEKLRNIKQHSTCEKQHVQVIPKLASVSTPIASVIQKKEMNRILVMQRLSDIVQNPHQINIHKNDIKVYPYLNISNVVSAAYDSTSERIIFSRFSPDGIFYSKVNKARVKTVRMNVKTYGMAVDGKRKLIFLTTYHPKHSISRMSTGGKYFRGIVDLDKHGSYKPFGIAVDDRKKLVYVCEYDRLSVVDYDGKQLRALEPGISGIYTVAIDTINNNLFFSVYQKVMMKSLSSGVTTEIMEHKNDLWKIVYHNNSLYTSSYNGSDIDVIYLENKVHYHLEEMLYDNNDIILIP